MQTTLDFQFNTSPIGNQTTKTETWKRIISNMTNEEIEKRSLLVSFCEPTEENETFQILLTNEYNKRKNN